MKGFGLPRKKPPTEEEYFKDLKRKVTIFTAFVLAALAAPYILEKVSDNINVNKASSYVNRNKIIHVNFWKFLINQISNIKNINQIKI